jgi:hypothetical protein
MDRLENGPVLMNVNLNTSTQKRTQRNEYLEFSLSAALEKKPEVAPAAPAPEPKEKPAAKQRGTT